MISRKKNTRLRKFNPLFLQIIAVLTLLTLVITIFASLVLENIEKKSYGQYLQNEAARLSTALSGISRVALRTGNWQSLENTLAGLSSTDPRLLSVQLLDTAGRELYAWGKPKAAMHENIKFLFPLNPDLESGEVDDVKILLLYDAKMINRALSEDLNREQTLLFVFFFIFACLFFSSIYFLVMSPVRKVLKRLQQKNINQPASREQPYIAREIAQIDELVSSYNLMANAVLKEHERTVRFISETPALVYGVSTDDYLGFVNPAFEKTTGYHLDELQGTRWRELLHWRSQCNDEEDIARSLEDSGGYHHCEAILVTKKGEFKTILWSHFLHNDEEGEVSEIIGFGTDITERKKMEEKFHFARDEWERTFDSIADIVTIQNPDLRIIMAKKAARDALRISFNEIIGQPGYAVFMQRDKPSKKSPEYRAVHERKSFSDEMELAKNGKRYLISASPIFNSSGGIKGIIHIARDITDQRKLEDQLRQAQKMEAIGTLAGGIAHDFNNILGAVLGFTELALLDAEENTSIHESLREIRTAGRRAKELVAQMLAFSRQRESSRNPVIIAPIIKEALKLLRCSLPSTIRIIENIDTDAAKVMADPAQLHQIIMNLCTNAYQTMREEGGELVVDLHVISSDDQLQTDTEKLPPGKYVVLKVSDTGQGMGKEMIKKVFDPFYTTREVGEGSGLGLSVVHGIIKSYKGGISIESDPGKGSLFSIYFPLLDSEDHMEPQDVVSLPPTGKERILLLDDEESLIRMGERMLKYLGYEIIATTSSEEALDIFRRHSRSIDLVITDQTMPGITGLDLAGELLKIKKNQPIIICSGFSEKLTIETVQAAGVRGVLLKPLSIHGLAESVRKALA